MADKKCPSCGQDCIAEYDDGQVEFDCGTTADANGEIERQTLECAWKTIELLQAHIAKLKRQVARLKAKSKKGGK